MYIFLLHAARERGREGERELDTHTERKRDTKTEKKTHAHEGPGAM